MGAESRSTGFIRRPLSSSKDVVFFLSSGSDLLDDRNHFEELVRVVNEQLYLARRDYSLDHVNLRVLRWEQDAPQRVDGDANARFRQMAADATVTVVLLWNELRPGTKEEIREALKEPSVQVATLRLAPERPNSNGSRELKRYLNRRKQRFIWEPTGGPRSQQLSASMMKIIARTVGDVWASGVADGVERETFSEDLGL